LGSAPTGCVVACFWFESAGVRYEVAGLVEAEAEIGAGEAAAVSWRAEGVACVIDLDA
jgi:hypothetical protein